MRLIDADELNKVKFHELPYTHIVPADLPKLQTEAYERGWNDAIDAIMESADTIDAEPARHGKWKPYRIRHSRSVKGGMYDKGLRCSLCNYGDGDDEYTYCPNCGAKMDEAEP